MIREIKGSDSYYFVIFQRPVGLGEERGKGRSLKSTFLPVRKRVKLHDPSRYVILIIFMFLFKH